MIYSSILDQGWCLQMKIARVIEEAKGRSKARTFVGSVGSLMVLIGLYLLLASSFLPLFQSGNQATSSGHTGEMSLAEGD